MKKKNTFVMYTDMMNIIDSMSNEDAGDLFRGILHYANGNPPEFTSQTAVPIWGLVKARMDKDSASYEEVCKKRSENGKKGVTSRWNSIANDSKCYNTVANDNKPLQAIHDNDYEYDNDKSLKKESKEKTRFAPPTLENVIGYCQEKGYSIDCERFIDFYSSKGWMVGKNKMKDWKAAVRNWARQDKEKPVANKPKNTFTDFQQRAYDYDDIEKQLLGEQ